jgi:hypothetical protein
VKREGILSAAQEDEAFKNLVLLHVEMWRGFMALVNFDESRELVLAGLKILLCHLGRQK